MCLVVGSLHHVNAGNRVNWVNCSLIHHKWTCEKTNKHIGYLNQNNGIQLKDSDTKEIILVHSTIKPNITNKRKTLLNAQLKSKQINSIFNFN